MSMDEDATEFHCPVCRGYCDVDGEEYLYTDDERDECTSKCPMCGAEVVVVVSYEVYIDVRKTTEPSPCRLTNATR